MSDPGFVRAELVELIADHIGGDHHFIRPDMPEVVQRARENVAGRAADAILEAGFVRQTSDPSLAEVEAGVAAIDWTHMFNFSSSPDVHDIVTAILRAARKVGHE